MYFGAKFIRRSQGVDIDLVYRELPPERRVVADRWSGRGGRVAARLPGRFRAVVFDMDGLLIDSEPLWLRAERAVLARAGHRDPGLAKADTVGMAPAETMARYGQLLGLDRPAIDGLYADLEAEMRALYSTAASVRPGAIGLVAALRGRVPLAIASNTGCELVLFALAATGFDGAFDVVVSSEEVERPKPAPDVYLEACRRLAVAPGDTVALEDSPSGVAAAKAAGLTVYAVPQLPGVDVSAADLVLDSLADVAV